MNSTFHYFISKVILLVCIAACHSPKDEGLQVKDKFSDIAAAFKNPPNDYSTAPFWVWNDAVTEEKIDFQLKKFKDQNINQVFIHPRPGLITEYLSDDWFQLCEYAMHKADSLDMEVWLYDENSFPSGFGGGHVPAEMPESYNQGNALGKSVIDDVSSLELEKYEVVVQQREAAFVLISDLSDIDTAAGKIYAFEKYFQELSGWHGGFAYTDLLIPGVTEKFIDITMEGYESTIGDEFGRKIKGVFTDEPNISPRAGENSIRWTPSLFKDFENRWSYDLRNHLPSLFDAVGDWKRVRHNYYGLLLELFIERWSKPWYEYTEKHNLVWTGHYWEHGWPSPHHGGDNMAMYAWHQMPGIDMLFNTFDARPDQFGNVRAVKELSSVANQLGRKRTLSETYGGAGWELSFEDMKRLGDWEYTLGVNFMNQHLAYMTFKGRRKGDFPQSISYQAPYWEDYGELAAYYARLSLALAHGEQRNKVLVLEPTTAAWMYYSPERPHDRFERFEPEFRALLDSLEAFQLEYDLGCENIIKDHGSIEGKQFVIGARSYDVVVLPPGMENVDQPTYNLIKQYLENGGEILAFSGIPNRVDGIASNDFEQLIEQNNFKYQEAKGLNNEMVLRKLQNEGFKVTDPLDIEGKVYHQRRQFADGQVLFWSNFNRESQATGTFSVHGKDISVMEPLSGEIKQYPHHIQEGKVKADFNLPPAGHLLLFVHNDNVYDDNAVVQSFSEKAISTSSTTISRTSPNVLTIDYLDLEVGGRKFEDIYFSMAADSAYMLNGLKPYGRTGYNPWAVAVQYKTNIIDMGEAFGPASGFDATYHFEIEDDVEKNLKAVVEWAHLYDITVNGKPVKPMPGEWWMDRSFDVLDLTEHVISGDNELTLSVNPMHIHAEIEPVYILGDFDVKYNEHGFALQSSGEIEVGSWKDQGMPFYGEGVLYTKHFEANKNVQYSVKLNDWNGTVASVNVNGEQCGIIGWPPYEFDITPWVNDGTNKVSIEIVGSLKNTLGPHHNNPRRGIVTPWSWFYAPQHQPAGNEYHLLDYGLYEDFDIVEKAEHENMN